MSIQLGSNYIIFDERLWDFELMIIERKNMYFWEKLFRQGMSEGGDITVKHDSEVKVI